MFLKHLLLFVVVVVVAELAIRLKICVVFVDMLSFPL
jgi:hypothetical protein